MFMMHKKTLSFINLHKTGILLTRMDKLKYQQIQKVALSCLWLHLMMNAENTKTVMSLGIRFLLDK